MKIAVIVVGSHYAGKSKTINKYLKPRLKIRSRAHKFTLGGASGKCCHRARRKQHGDLGLCVLKASKNLDERPLMYGDSLKPMLTSTFWFLLLAPAMRAARFLLC